MLMGAILVQMLLGSQPLSGWISVLLNRKKHISDSVNLDLWLGTSYAPGCTSIITFLSRHTIKLPSKFINLYSQISEANSHYQKGFFAQWTRISAETHYWLICRKIMFVACSVIMGHLYYNTSSLLKELGPYWKSG